VFVGVRQDYPPSPDIDVIGSIYQGNNNPNDPNLTKNKIKINNTSIWSNVGYFIISLSPIFFNLFINDIFNNCNELGVYTDNNKCCGGLFADDIVLCAPNQGQIKKKNA